jgi:mono/diheme cytochrome c family protein
MRSWIAILMAGCAAHIEPAQIDAVVSLQGDPTAGKVVYGDHCEECHDSDGQGRKHASLPEDVPQRSERELVETVLSGPSYMPNFVNKLEDQQVADVVAYLEATFGTGA